MVGCSVYLQQLSYLTCFADHSGKKFADNRTSFSHFTLSGIGQIWNNPHDVACWACLGSIGNDEQFHDVIVDIPALKENRKKNFHYQRCAFWCLFRSSTTTSAIHPQKKLLEGRHNWSFHQQSRITTYNLMLFSVHKTSLQTSLLSSACRS